MVDVGVTDISIYTPRYYLSHQDLAEARGIPVDKFHIGLGNFKMSIIPNWEDSVTMAANAAYQLLKKTDTDPKEIRQMVVSTESGVDYSKPVASYVQELLGIGTRCRIYEVKHACYGGTAGLINSVDRIARTKREKEKALVIMSDIAHYGFESLGEPTQGAGSVAMLVERDPKLFSLDTTQNGIYSKSVFDFWRPSGHAVPVVDGHYSIECYLNALEASAGDLKENMDLDDGTRLIDALDYVVYHMPYCNMAKKAHRHFVDLQYGDTDEEGREKRFKESFQKMVEPGLFGAREVGNIYTGSVYMGLISLLEAEGEKAAGKKVGIFSYGSGCGAEFLICNINEAVGRIIDGLNFKKQLDRREKISIEHYTHIYSKRLQDVKYFPQEARHFKDEYTQFVFTGIEDHKRQYV
jgi:hydroxymethylglutaryl-CoA synthase